MNKLQKDTTEYILYSPDSLKYITDNIYKPLDESITFYKKLFDIKEFRKVQINFFDNIEDFRNYIYELRKDGKVLPSYAKGTFDKGMINAFIETNWLVNSPMYNKKLYMASHELFHIMYKELIWEKENKQRIIWFDEGMAQRFSGEYSEGLNDENFSFWFNSLIENTKEIPNLNDLSHGDGFETPNYSGYKLSLLAVKYLCETLSFDDFKALMHNTKEILEYGKTVVNDAISYYKEKLRGGKNEI